MLLSQCAWRKKATVESMQGANSDAHKDELVDNTDLGQDETAWMQSGCVLYNIRLSHSTNGEASTHTRADFITTSIPGQRDATRAIRSSTSRTCVSSILYHARKGSLSGRSILEAYSEVRSSPSGLPRQHTRNGHTEILIPRLVSVEYALIPPSESAPGYDRLCRIVYNLRQVFMYPTPSLILSQHVCIRSSASTRRGFPSFS